MMINPFLPSVLFLGCDQKTPEDTAIEISCELRYYEDKDGDGYGTSKDVIDSCTQPDGYSRYSSDCNDRSAATHPGAEYFLYNCIGGDDDAIEPNDGFESATEIFCDEEIQAAMSSDDDEDYYVINATEPTQITADRFSTAQDLSGYVYNGDHDVVEDIESWIAPPIYIRVRFSNDSTGLNQRDPSYLLQLGCDVCVAGTKDYSTCDMENDIVYTYDECGNVMDTENCLDWEECESGACCDDENNYSCGFWDGEEAIFYSNECDDINLALWQVCPEDERCGRLDGEIICSDIF